MLKVGLPRGRTDRSSLIWRVPAEQSHSSRWRQMKNAASRVHSNLQLNHTESTQELALSIRLPHLCKCANRLASALITHTVTRMYLHHTRLHTWVIMNLILWFYGLCCISVMTLNWNKNLYDGGSAIFFTAAIFIKPKRQPDFEKYDVRWTQVFHHIRYLVRMLRFYNYPIMYIDVFLFKMVVRFISDKALGGCFTMKDIYRAVPFLLPLQGKPKARRMMNGFNERIA